MLRILPLILFSLGTFAAEADTQITISDIQGGVSKISSNGERARMNSKGDPTYAIAVYQTGEFFVVNPERKEVMNMDMNAMPEPTATVEAGDQLAISLDKKGKGPKIAGYKTKEYVLKANGQNCGTIFGSKNLLKKKGVSELFEFMNRMRRQSMKMMGAFSGAADICEQAMQDVSLSFEKTGAPLRMLNAQGELESEVTKVKTEKSIDAAYYDIPADFAVVSVADQINAASQQNQQMMEQMGQNMPNMEELMQQMQSQGGEVPAEAMEQLKKMQEMFKQYQQPQQ